jgi:N-acetylmuramoyl-L-alanine amidase/Tfp pilus assembly protein PilF
VYSSAQTSDEPFEALRKLEEMAEREIQAFLEFEGRSGRGPLRVILDPGHGGWDRGAVGPDGSCEKDLTLALARAIKDVLAGEATVEVVLTREGDYFLDLGERSLFADWFQADIFLSLHLNGHSSASASGLEIYTCSPEASDADARRVAERENAVVQDVGFLEDPPHLIDDERLLMTADRIFARKRSTVVAHRVQSMVASGFPLADRGVKTGDFYVLRKNRIPSLLLEVGFITNPNDLSLLQEEESRYQLARLLAGFLVNLANPRTWRETLVEASRLGSDSLGRCRPPTGLWSEYGAKRLGKRAQSYSRHEALRLLEAGLRARDLGRLEVARGQLEKATMLDPSLTAGWDALGTVRLQLGEDEKAQEAFERALEGDPGDLFALERLCLLKLATGDLERGEALALQILDRDSRHGMGNLLLGFVRRLQGDALGAARAFLVASRSDYREAVFHRLLAEELDRLGLAAAARLEYVRAYRNDRRNVQVCYRLAWHLYVTGEEEAAMRLWREILRIQPRSYDARRSLSFALGRRARRLEAAGLKEEADRLWREALTVDPWNRAARARAAQ